jgi:hypothetical protein
MKRTGPTRTNPRASCAHPGSARGGVSYSTVPLDPEKRNALEDQEDVAAFQERAHEPDLAFEGVLNDVRSRRHGRPQR